MADPRPAPRARRARLVRYTAVAVASIALASIALGLAFAGSPTKLPEGVAVSGVSLGGLTPRAARQELEERSRSLADTAVTFQADGHSWRLTPRQLGVSANWGAAVATALREGQGPVPVRGIRRLGVRLFGADVTPAAEAYDAALEYELDRIAVAIDRVHRDASLRLAGLAPLVVPGQAGRTLDRDAAARVIVQALASLERPASVELPVTVDQPSVSALDLQPVAAQVRTALSAPVRVTLAGTPRFRLPRYRLAQLLDLPHDGRTDLRIGGPRADAFFIHFSKLVDRAPRDASFAVTAYGARVVPAKDGRAVDVPATAASILRASLSPYNRRARVVIEHTQPSRTTEQAKAMGIKEVVGTFTTEYGGIANRIHNVQLVAHLIDNHLIEPGEEFSFNKTTGNRDASKGFLEAPVIINGELQTALGGGVCQVSTTVFNTAFEAGLKITARRNHALYISHYPQGRDATVNYPDTDLRFVNDTGHWLWLRTFVGASSLTVTLYGTNPHRKVVSTTSPLVATGPAPVKKLKDVTLFKGVRQVDEPGSPSLSTSVERKVYDASGKLLDDDVWYSRYRGEYRIVRIGTKKKPAKAKPVATDAAVTPIPQQ